MSAGLPPEAVTAAYAEFQRAQQSAGWDKLTPTGQERWRRIAAAAAPAIRAPAVRLVEEALHLRANGERAPGGGETWAGWERAAQEYLRGLAP